MPNAMTLANLLMGMLGIIAMTNALVGTALWLMLGCLVADVLDGYLARKLGAAGDLGIQLDSLADVVSFGVLPAMMLFYCGTHFGGSVFSQQTIAVFAAISAVSAGLRLGRFNIDTRPREYFRGLATPAGGIMVAAWLWAQHSNRDYGLGAQDIPWLGILIPVFLAVMYQVPLRLPGLKSPRAGLFTIIVVAAISLAGFWLCGPLAVFLGIVLYVALGLVNLLLKWY